MRAGAYVRTHPLQAEDRHAKVDQLRPTIGRSPLEAVELGHRSIEADLEPLDLPEPAVGAGLADAFSEVLVDLDEAWPLAGIRPEDGQRMQASLNQTIALACRSRLGPLLRVRLLLP